MYEAYRLTRGVEKKCVVAVLYIFLFGITILITHLQAAFKLDKRGWVFIFLFINGAEFVCL